MTKENSLGRLMELSQRGDRVAYGLLLRETESWLRNYYFLRIPIDAVDDAVKDAIIAVHEKRHTYDPIISYGAWLEDVAEYKLTKRIRKTRESRVASWKMIFSARAERPGPASDLI